MHFLRRLPVSAVGWHRAGAILFTLVVCGCQNLPRPTWSTSTTTVTQASGGARTESQRSRTGRSRDSAVVARAIPPDDEPLETPLNRPAFAGQEFLRMRSPVAERCSAGQPFATGLSSLIADEDPGDGLQDYEPTTVFESNAGHLARRYGDEPAPCDPDEDSQECCANAPISFRQDMRDLWPSLRDDTVSLFTWKNALVLGIAAGGAVAMRDNLDQRVRYETLEHPLRWGEGSEVLRQFGEYSYQVPVLAGGYVASLWVEDDTFHEFMKATISAYSLTSITTVAIKGITNTTRPSDGFEGGHYGFPSFHTASTFSIAAVIDEYYGWQAALPAYVLAGLVGWSRIDQREHDLSDVVFGSVLGLVIGHTVGAAHLDRHDGLRVGPYYEPQNRATGVAVEKRF